MKGARRKPNQKDTDQQSEKQRQQSIAKENKPYIDRLTEIADQLIAQGISGIYSMSYDAIQASTVLWEYKAQDGNIYGPYTSQQISEWKSLGFLTGPTAVPIRKVTSLKKTKIDSIYDDDDEDEDNDYQVGPDTKKVRTNDGHSDGNAVVDEWKNSDEIDFGEYIDLNKFELDKRRVSQSNPNSNNSRIGSNDAALDEDDEDDDIEEVLSRGRRKKGVVEHDEDD